ncbi:MAG: hypothetical protein M1819_003186 [Sarea resinae]|nr:MAG: hypothetical protein M1819_003186 [Sarea resinae]
MPVLRSASTAQSKKPASKPPQSSKPAATQPPSSNAPPPHIRLFLTNLRLLDLDLRPDWPAITLQTFSTKDAQQNQKNRIRCVEWALFYLFDLWDAEGTRNKLKPFFPPLEPLQSLNLRAALFRCLNELKKDGVLGRDTVLRKTMLDECKGDRFEEVLAVFSAEVLRKVMKVHNSGDESVALQVATATRSSQNLEESILRLSIAHKASLSVLLRKKQDSRTRYASFAGLIDLKQRQITRRQEQLKLVGNDKPQSQNIGDKDADIIRQHLQDNWLGDPKWLEVVLCGDRQGADDVLLTSRFSDIWKHVELGDVGGIAQKATKGLLEDLEMRVNEQRTRLQHWKAFREEIIEPRMARLASDEEPATARSNPKISLKFEAHKELMPNKFNHSKTIPSKAQSSSLPLPPEHESTMPSSGQDYWRKISDLQRDLAKVGKSKAQGGSSWRKEKSRRDTNGRLAPDISDMDLALPRSLGDSPSLKSKTSFPGSEDELDGESQALSEGDNPPKAYAVQFPIRSPTRNNAATTEVPEPDTQLANKTQVSDDTEFAKAWEHPVNHDMPLRNEMPPPALPAKRPKNMRVSLLDTEGQELLAEEIVSSVMNSNPSPAKSRPSLLERTRMSMAFSSHEDLHDAIEEEEMPPLTEDRTKLVPDTVDSLNRRATLLERTRQSMSAFSAASYTRKSVYKPPRPSFPVNQFETPRKQQASHADDSNSSTPKEELFSVEAEYASVFKSRPKIALSPMASPVAGEDFSALEGMSALDEEAELEAWGDSPVPRGRMPPFFPRKRHYSPSPPPSRGTGGSATPGSGGRKPTIFDTLEARPTNGRTVEDNKAFLETLDDESDSSLSDISSSEDEEVFEDVPPSKRRKVVDKSESAEEDVDWEDAFEADTSAPIIPAAGPPRDLELRLDKDEHIAPLASSNGKKKGPSKIERQIRIQTHCMHVQFLLFHNLVRNAWVCDKEVQNNLVRQLPPGVQEAFDKWKVAAGLSGKDEEIRTMKNQKRKGKSKSSGRVSSLRGREQRDWGQEAERQEQGVPDMSRGDPTIRFLKLLSAYWKKRFRTTAPGLRKQGYKTLDVLEKEVSSFQSAEYDPEEHGERIESLEEFRELAKRCEGSRDAGAQLFTALLRGLGFDARMVASLQPVGYGWSKNEDAAAKKLKLKSQSASPGKRETDDDADDDEPKSKEPPAKDRDNPSKQRKINPRSAKKPGQKAKASDPIEISTDSSELSSLSEEEDDDDSVIDVTPLTPQKAINKSYDKDLEFPIYWTEVLSPLTNSFIPVDPVVRSIVTAHPDTLASFEPRGTKAEKAKQVLAYVVAYSADGTAKDVTVRYLKRHVWPGKTKSVRIPIEKVPVYNHRGKVKKYEELDWFKTAMSAYSRDASKRTAVDDLEEEKDLKPVKAVKDAKAGREETLQGYKNSAEFVLERHLRREEALKRGSKHVKTFVTGKGDKATEEKVYRREDVVVCKTIESWHKEGRQAKLREQPLKMVPVRAVTLTRKREIEEFEKQGGEKLKQGLYSREQTDWIIPPPIKDGVIPKNAFGNMDCYVPTMIPKGAVHIPLKGTAKICKRLAIDFAEAVTGFEFGKQRAVPVVTGVVVAAENENLVIDAWEVAEVERKRKEDTKREKAALAMWRKFLMGLRIVERVKEEYGGDADAHMMDELNPFTNKNKLTDKSKGHSKGEDGPRHSAKAREHDPMDEDMAGGFLPDGEDVIAEPGTAQDRDDYLMEGGFVPENEDDIWSNADGLTSEHDEEQAGGFLIEEDEESPAKKKPRSSRVQPHTPMSLQSMHRKERLVDARIGSDDSDDSEPGAGGKSCSDSVLNEAEVSRSQTRSEGRRWSKQPQVKGSISNNKRAQPKRSRKAKTISTSTDETVNSSSLSDLDSSPEPFPFEGEDKHMESASEGAKGERLVGERGATQRPRAAPKRRAARKSEMAVRSHYFAENSDDQKDGVQDVKSIKRTTRHAKPVAVGRKARARKK